MNNDSKKTSFPEYIYPPPLLDSLGLMSRLLEEDPGHWNGIWEECNRLLNSASAKAPIYSMPCLVGESIKEILLFADKLCWNTPEYSVITINDDTDQSTEDLYDFPTLCNSSARPISLCFAYNAHKDRYEARRFCPIFISRPAHKKFDNSVSFVVCVYTIAAKKSALKEFYFDKAANRFPNRDDEGRRMLSLFEIKSIRWMGVHSLRKTDLYEAADKLSMEVNVLRELFRQQTYQLYGVVPSFLHSVKGRSCPQENDQRGWDGGDVTVSVHPHTANWWTLAQNYQYRALAPHKNIGRVPHEFPFPNKHFYYDLDDPDWEAIDEFYGDHAGFSTHWKAKLICELDRGATNLETLVRYHFFDAEAKRPRCSFTIKAAADIAPFLHADQYQCAELTHVPFENYQFSIPPVEFPLRLLRQNREQHDLLTQTYKRADGPADEVCTQYEIAMKNGLT